MSVDRRLGFRICRSEVDVLAGMIEDRRLTTKEERKWRAVQRYLNSPPTWGVDGKILDAGLLNRLRVELHKLHDFEPAYLLSLEGQALSLRLR